MPELLPGCPVANIDALSGRDRSEPNPERDPRPALRAAQVVTAVKRMAGRESLVFGRDALARIAADGRPELLLVVRVALDMETDDLEKLLALVRVIKGRHEYESGDEPDEGR